MNKCIIGVLFILMFASMASASEYYEIDLYDVEVRGEESWDSRISAEDNEWIDVRGTVHLGWSDAYYDYFNYGTETIPAGEKVEAFVKVEARNGSNWEILYNNSGQTEYLYSGESEYFSWDNLFEVDDYYDEYMVTVNARIIGEETHTQAAYVDIEGQDSYECSDIKIYEHSIIVNEGEIEYETFEVQNLSGNRFYIDDFDFYDNESFFESREYDNDESIAPQGTGNLEVRVEGFNVSDEEYGVAYLRLGGHFEGGGNCDYSDIGTRQVGVRVRDNEGNGVCGDIDLETRSIHIKENRSENFTLTLENNSSDDFYVEDVTVWDSSGYLRSEAYSHDKWLDAGEEGDIEIRIESENVSSDKSTKVNVRIEGYFVNGRDCGYNDILEEFTVYIDESGSGIQNCDDIEVTSKTVYLDEDERETVRFTVRNYSDERFDIEDIEVYDRSSYFDLEEDDWSDRIYSNGSGWIEFTAKGRNVSFDRSGTGYIRIEGEFANGESCSFGDIEEEEFTVKVSEDGYNDDDDSGYGECGEVDIDVHDFSIEKGETLYEQFRLRNTSNRNFYVDQVEAYDYTNELVAEEFTWDDRVNEDESGNLTVKVKAYNDAEAGRYRAYVKVSGHFTDGGTCSYSSIGTEDFYITVKGESTTDGECEDFELKVESEKEIIGSGLVAVKVENGSGESGTISLSGTGLSVSPSEIIVPAGKNFTRLVEVKLLKEGDTYLVYDVDLDGCEVKSQSTKILVSSREAIELISYPSTKVLEGKEAILVRVRNNSSESREVEVSLEGLPGSWNAEKASREIEAGKTVTFTLDVEPEGFGTFVGELVVSFGEKEITKEIEFESVLGGELVEVESEVIAPLTGSNYEVKINVKNLSEENLVGEVKFFVPSDWEISGEKDFSLEEGKETELSFTVTPDKQLSEKESIEFELDFGDKGTIEDSAELAANTTIVSTGLALIGTNLVGAGLVVIILILVYALFKK